MWIYLCVVPVYEAPVNETDPLCALIRLRPDRDLPEAEREKLGASRWGKGRPRRVEPAPPPQDTYLQRLDELRGAALDVDRVFAACRAPEERDAEVINESMREVAAEAAAIAYERREAERRGQDPSRLCSRRVRALTSLAALVVERARLGGDLEVDPRDERVQRVVGLFFRDISEIAQETLGAETAEKFTSAFLARVNGWAERLGRR